MLGLSSGLIKGTSVLRSIVKKGLQAWYKADQTQAPLGEEEIANGRFDKKGPDLIAGEGGLTGAFTGSNFTHHSDGTMTINGDGNRNWAGGNVEGDSVYKVTVDIVSGTSGKFFIGGISSSLFSGTGINVRYIKTSSSSNLDFVSFNDCDGMVIRSCSVEKMDLNNDWRDFNVNTWQVEDGKLSHTQGNGDSLQCRQNNVIQANKKYQVSYSIVDYTSGSVRVDLGDANRGTARSAVGDYSEIITNTGTATFVDIEPVTGGAGTFKGAISNVSIKEITNSVKDFSSNTNNGVLYSGKCLHFDSSNYIDIDYWASKTIDANTKATFATWVNPDDIAEPGDYIFGAWTVDNTALFYLGIKENKLDLGWGNSGWTSSVTSGALPTLVNHTWYRVVAVVDGLTCKVYLNGEFVFSKTNSSSFTIHSTGISIGAQGDGVGDHLYGELADFQIYDKAWTPSDAAYDYNNPDKDVFDDEGRAEVLGEELVSNGNFNTDTAGWNAKLGTIAYDSGALKFGPLESNGSGGPWQNIGLEANKSYAVTITMKLITSGGGSPKIGVIVSQNNGGGQVGVAQGSSLVAGGPAVTETLYFTGIQDRVSIQPWTDSAAGTVFTVDNISVREVLTHAGEIYPTDCTALYRLNEGAGNRLYNAAPVLREDIHSGYDFDDWSALSNATINSPTTFSTSSVSTGIFKIHVTSGSAYKLTIAGTTESNGLQFANPSTGSDVYWDSGSSTGAFSDTVIFNAKSTQIYLKNKTAGETTITTLKLQEISLSESYAQEDWAANRWITAQPYIPQYAMSSYSKKMIFDGDNDLVDCGEGAAIDNIFDGGGSWSAWFSVETDGESSAGTMLSKEKARIRTKDDGGGDTTIEFLHIFDGDPGVWTAPTDAVLLNKINHIVVTYNNSNASNVPKIYINGVSVTVNTGTPPTGTRESDTSDELTIGAQNDAGAKAYDGFIDEVSVWGKELSVTEVQEIFNAGMALDCRDHSAFLGDEEVVDGDFALANNVNWTKNAEDAWTFSGGKASVDSSGTAGLLQTLSGVTVGKVYDVSFEISDYSYGSFQFASGVFFPIGTSTSIPNATSNGTYSYRTIAQASSPGAYVYGVNESKFSVDNISVKEVQLNGYWRNNGTDTWYDLSPYGNNGTVNGSPTTIQLQEVPYFKKDTFGLPMNKVRQKGLNFDEDSYVQVTHDSSLGDMSDGFTCMFWYRHAEDIDLNNWFHLVSKGTSHDNSSVNNGFGTSSYNNEVYAHIRTSSGLYSVKHTISGASPKDPKWWHIAATYDGSGSGKTNTMKLYINGNEEDTKALAGSITSTSNAHPIMIGTDYINDDKLARGVIDEVKWYNRDLELKEIERDYKATKSRHSSTSAWSDDFSDGFI